MSRLAVRLGGVLGTALAANHSGRLRHFITDERSPAIALFDPARVARNHEGDWYGEHAGKWLCAAAKAAARTQDAELAARVRHVADYLVSVQQPNGYLGTYAPERRFTVKQQPPQGTWDGAPSRRTWDIWVHAYLILGLLEVHAHFPDVKYLEAACKMGELCRKAIVEDGTDITHLGNHHGMSATVLLDAVVELYFATRAETYLHLAGTILEQADARPELQLLTRALAGCDAFEIGTGKAYQLSWNCVGLAKLYRANGDERLLKAVLNVWESIREWHLTLGGGPWGGVGLRSREIFNPPRVFSPYGYVETCSTFSWIQLNRALLEITGEARFAEEIERSAYNDLVGASAPNGEDWCYYSFPNGKRVFTTHWRCCKSSGAMALEELPEIAYSVVDEQVIVVNLYGPGQVSVQMPRAGMVTIEQVTRYPFDGAINLRVAPQRPARFSIRVRIPAWTAQAELRVNGVVAKETAAPGTYATLDREWQAGDEIALNFPMTPVVHRRSNRNLQESMAPDGSPVRQEVLHFDYMAITRGPLVYSTDLIDGFKIEETLRVADEPLLEVEDTQGEEGGGVTIRLQLDYRAPLIFRPYFEAGGRKDGTWRLTWMQVAPLTASSTADPVLLREP